MLFKTFFAIALAITAEAIHLPIEKRSNNIAKQNIYANTATTYYLTSVQLGSNQDNVTLLVDTGAFLDKDSVCKTCHEYGTYDSHSSNTVKRLSPYQSCFANNYCYFGEQVKDDVYYNGLKISNYQFGDVHNDTAFQLGILGLSKPPQKTPNENIVLAGKKAGVLNSAAYSFYLSSSQETEGSLILGGIDHAKIQGDITYSDISKTNIGGFVDTIEFNGFNFTYNKYITADTGGAMLNIPSAQYEIFLDLLPQDPLNPRGSGYINSRLLEGNTIKLTINKKTYEFPALAFIRPTDVGNEHAQIIAIKGDSAQLGAYFFRYLYFVVNYDNYTQGIALVKNTTETNIQPI